MTYQKGQSGNPGGRARGVEKLFRERMGQAGVDEAIDFLMETMKDKTVPMRDRLRALEIMLDRGWGKARQIVDIGNEINVDTLDLTKLTAAQLDDYIAKAEAQAAVGSPDDGEPRPASS